MPFNTYDIERRAQSELQDGEHLIWAGEPRPLLLARKQLPISFFGIFFAGFAAFWIAVASGILSVSGDNVSGPFSFFPLFGIPFLLVGLSLIFSPLWKFRQAKRTFYALTDRRVILWIAKGLSGIDIRSYSPQELGKITRRERADGSGDLVLEEIMTLNGNSRSYTTRVVESGFLAIDDVREVEKKLRSTLLKETMSNG